MKTIIIGLMAGILLTVFVQYWRVEYFSSLFAGTAQTCTDPNKSYQVDIYWSTEMWHFDFNWKCKDKI